jgi:hypothetical protein
MFRRGSMLLTLSLTAKLQLPDSWNDNPIESIKPLWILMRWLKFTGRCTLSHEVFGRKKLTCARTLKSSSLVNDLQPQAFAVNIMWWDYFLCKRCFPNACVGACEVWDFWLVFAHGFRCLSNFGLVQGMLPTRLAKIYPLSPSPVSRSVKAVTLRRCDKEPDPILKNFCL